MIQTKKLNNLKKKSIPTLFKEHGEHYFRQCEANLCSKLIYYDEWIISTGGGFLLPEENTKVAKALGIILFLDASFETLYSRIKHDPHRPLAVNKNTLKERFDSRYKTYKALATYRISTDNKTISDIANEAWTLYDTFKYPLNPKLWLIFILIQP